MISRNNSVQLEPEVHKLFVTRLSVLRQDVQGQGQDVRVLCCNIEEAVQRLVPLLDGEPRRADDEALVERLLSEIEDAATRAVERDNVPGLGAEWEYLERLRSTLSTAQSTLKTSLGAVSDQDARFRRIDEHVQTLQESIDRLRLEEAMLNPKDGVTRLEQRGAREKRENRLGQIGRSVFDKENIQRQYDRDRNEMSRDGIANIEVSESGHEEVRTIALCLTEIRDRLKATGILDLPADMPLPKELANLQDAVARSASEHMKQEHLRDLAERSKALLRSVRQVTGERRPIYEEVYDECSLKATECAEQGKPMEIAEFQQLLSHQYRLRLQLSFLHIWGQAQQVNDALTESLTDNWAICDGAMAQVRENFREMSERRSRAKETERKNKSKWDMKTGSFQLFVRTVKRLRESEIEKQMLAEELELIRIIRKAESLNHPLQLMSVGIRGLVQRLRG